jgi:LmbE family N-acetylglucosaminyl deacetylase
MTDFEFPSTPIEPLREDWDTALAVVAHPDDLEYGTAAAIARWTAAGKKVVYCLLTSGEAGIDGMTPEEAAPVREDEERASAAVVGVTEVEFLGFADGVLENSLELRKAVSASIRRHRPDVIITGYFGRTWGPGFFNQADHINAGLAVVDAIPAAANRWIFRELLDDGLEPWKGVRALLVGSPDGTHGVDVTDFMDAGVRSLQEHKAYLEGLGDPDFDAKPFLEGFAATTGARLGVPFAVAFEIYKFGDF